MCSALKGGLRGEAMMVYARYLDNAKISSPYFIHKIIHARYDAPSSPRTLADHAGSSAVAGPAFEPVFEDHLLCDSLEPLHRSQTSRGRHNGWSRGNSMDRLCCRLCNPLFSSRTSRELLNPSLKTACARFIRHQNTRIVTMCILSEQLPALAIVQCGCRGR